MPSFMDVFSSDASSERRRDLEEQKRLLEAKRDTVDRELDDAISRADFLAEPLTVDRLREQVARAGRPRTARIMSPSGLGGDVFELGGDLGPLEDPTIGPPGFGQGPGQVRMTGTKPTFGTLPAGEQMVDPVLGDIANRIIPGTSDPGQSGRRGVRYPEGPVYGERGAEPYDIESDISPYVGFLDPATRYVSGKPADQYLQDFVESVGPIQRPPDDRDFSYYPDADAPSPGEEVPKLDSQGNVILDTKGDVKGWTRAAPPKKEPRGPAEERPGEIAPEISGVDDLPEEGPVGEAPELPTDAEIDTLMEQMPTQEGRTWLGKIRDHVKRNWKKYAAGGAMAVGAKVSEDFREGLAEGVKEGLDYERAVQLANIKKGSKAGQKIEGNRIVSYGASGEILAIHDLGSTPKEIRDEVKDYTKSAPYKKILNAQTNWGKLEASVDANNPIGDIGAMFGFISGLDDTAVRDGERAMILGAGSLASKIKYYLGLEEGSRGYIDGRQLTQEQLKGMKEIARQFYGSEIETFRGYRKDYVSSIGATDPRTNFDQYFKDPTRDFEVGGAGGGTGGGTGGGGEIRTLSTGKKVKKVNGQWVEVSANPRASDSDYSF